MAVCKIVMTSNLLIAHSEHEFHGMFHISYIHCILYLFIYSKYVSWGTESNSVQFKHLTKNLVSVGKWLCGVLELKATHLGLGKRSQFGLKYNSFSTAVVSWLSR